MARKDYPNETCGAMLGVDGERPRSARAFSADQSPRRFAAQPLFGDRRRCARRGARAAEHGLELIGWYHSHPDHPARPSEFDREHAWPWYSYVIVSVRARASRRT